MFTLKISNFRSLLEEKFNFSRVNIIIGENSSGKSSVLKFLLVLKQSIQVPVNRELNLNLRGEFTDLGSYKDTIYYNDDSLPVKFTFGFQKEYFNYFLEELIDEEDSEIVLKSFKVPITSETEVSYSFSKELDVHEDITTRFYNESVGELDIIHIKSDEDKKLTFTNSCTLVYKDADGLLLELPNIEYEKQGFMSIVAGGSLHRTIDQFFKKAGISAKLVPTQTNKYFYRIAFLLVTQNYLRNILNKIEYINPLLTKPSRVYLARDQNRSLIINDIEDVVDYLSRNTQESNMVLQDLNIILSNFGITEGLEIIQDNRMLVKELRVKIKDLVSNIYDVGYGVALQIPMILKVLLAERMTSRHSTVMLIEQPEVHLHPRLHAALIEIFLSLGNSSTYFIETHSEHIVRKLQVMVKQQSYDLKPEDISIHYLTRTTEKTTVTNHRIQFDGMLKPNFPSGFFDASYNLAKELLE